MRRKAWLHLSAETNGFKIVWPLPPRGLLKSLTVTASTAGKLLKQFHLTRPTLQPDKSTLKRSVNETVERGAVAYARRQRYRISALVWPSFLYL